MSKVGNAVAGIFSAFLLFGSVCCCTTERSMHSQCRTWVETFFKMPLKEQIAEFSNYDIENQYTIFICGNQVVHPPAMYLAGPFSMEGEPVVNFLRERLSETKDDLTIRDIISVFVEMSRRKTYDVMGDSDLMKLLTDSIARIKDNDWRRITEQKLIRAMAE